MMSSINDRILKVAVIVLLAAMCVLPADGYSATTRIKMVADATEMPRRLLHSRITLDLDGDTVSLVYPKWVPGFHGPDGPIGNICRFVVSDAYGRPVTWERDWSEPYRFFVFPTSAPNPCTISLSYACNEDMTVYGFPGMATIDWHAVVVSPEDVPVNEVTVELDVVLPGQWDFATGLPLRGKRADTASFNPVSLERLIDMPLICGEHVATVALPPGNRQATYEIAVAAATAREVQDFSGGGGLAEELGRMFTETEALLGRPHFETYIVLCAVNNSVRQLGVEHRNSSLNFFNSASPAATSLAEDGYADLLTHEFVHSWCGKYRRPAGMCTGDYMTPSNLDLLWVYEGLAQYLGWVIAARAGLLTPDQVKQKLAHRLAESLFQKGRRWRSLRDVQVASYAASGRGRGWGYLQRGVDYYTEGAFLWLEIDTRIRESTGDGTSLDDFCAAFLTRGDRETEYTPFDYDEIVTTLYSVAPGPWDSLLTTRLRETPDDYDLSWLQRCGYELVFTTDKPEALTRLEEYYWYRDFGASIGIIVGHNNMIWQIVPDSPADRAGLYPGAMIATIDGETYSHARLDTAIQHSPDVGHVIMQIMENGVPVDMRVVYDGGLRYYTLRRLDGTPDRLAAILASKVSR